MKVKRILKWVIAIALAAGLVFIGIRLVQTIPVYPGFLREVGTYKKLQEPFAEESAVIFPEEPTGNVTETSYYIYLDGRTLSSETIGYGTHYYVEEHNTKIAYSRDCRIEEAGNWTSDTQYRGILYWLRRSESEDRVDTPRNHGYLDFCLEDYEYSLSYTIYIAGLTEEEVAAKEESANEELLQTMREIIDRYIEAMRQKNVAEANISVDEKTVLEVTAIGDFLVRNEENRSFTEENGRAEGTLPVYGMDFMVDGMGPSPLTFLVDDSSSFTCIAIGENSRILAFSVIGGEASGSIRADEDEAGWESVTIDDAGGIYTEASENQ